MISVLDEITKLRNDAPIELDHRNHNRYRVVLDEQDSSKTAYYFSAPIYNNRTGKLVDMRFHEKVRRLMRENGFYPELAVKFKPQRNGKSDGRYCENRLKQDFSVTEKNKVWAGDITYIKTSVGWVYLAVVMDLFNREFIGYDIGKKIDTKLVKMH